MRVCLVSLMLRQISSYLPCQSHTQVNPFMLMHIFLVSPMLRQNPFSFYVCPTRSMLGKTIPSYMFVLLVSCLDKPFHTCLISPMLRQAISCMLALLVPCMGEHPFLQVLIPGYRQNPTTLHLPHHLLVNSTRSLFKQYFHNIQATLSSFHVTFSLQLTLLHFK